MRSLVHLYGLSNGVVEGEVGICSLCGVGMWEEEEGEEGKEKEKEKEEVVGYFLDPVVPILFTIFTVERRAC